MKRSNYLDFLKGFAIICVVLGHCWLTPKDVIWLIYRFHMPLFFGISGYLMWGKMDCSFKEFTKRKAKQLLVPYVLFFLFSWIFSLAFLENKCSLQEAVQALFFSGKYLWAVNNWALWYLPAFFVALLVLYAMCKIKEKKIFVAMVVLVLGISPLVQKILYRQFSDGYIPWSIQTIFPAVGCLGVGCVMKIFNYQGKLNQREGLNNILSILAGCLGILLAVGNQEQMLHFESYRYLLAAFFLILFLIWISQQNENKIICYLGKNSLYIYGTHRVFLFYFQQRDVESWLKTYGITGLAASLLVSCVVIGITLMLGKGANYCYEKIREKCGKVGLY